MSVKPSWPQRPSSTPALSEKRNGAWCESSFSDWESLPSSAFEEAGTDLYRTWRHLWCLMGHRSFRRVSPSDPRRIWKRGYLPSKHFWTHEGCGRLGHQILSQLP